eukprot:GHVU01181562.1.p1 GENE.GHVU01181562.1~~GHVU01181562.1.p1  ORF type:complete len:153 (+),score=4.49 GHVU01181562.1:841-1299(+)
MNALCVAAAFQTIKPADVARPPRRPSLSVGEQQHRRVLCKCRCSPGTLRKKQGNVQRGTCTRGALGGHTRGRQVINPRASRRRVHHRYSCDVHDSIASRLRGETENGGGPLSILTQVEDHSTAMSPTPAVWVSKWVGEGCCRLAWVTYMSMW